MGEDITQPTQSAGFVRAKYLKDALRRGSPPAMSGTGPLMQEVAAWGEDDPVIQKAYLDQLVECAPEAITILDSCHQVTRINSEFTRMFGFTIEEALGSPLDELVVPPDRTAESDWIQEAVEIHLKSMMEDGDPIPEPTSPREQVDMTKPRKRSKAGRSGRLLSL